MGSPAYIPRILVPLLVRLKKKNIKKYHVNIKKIQVQILSQIFLPGKLSVIDLHVNAICY